MTPQTPHWRNRNWQYVPANSTDIRKTFERVRREMAAAQKQKPQRRK